MGLFPCTPEEWEATKQKVARDIAIEKEAADREGFVKLTGWFGAICDEFYKANRFSAMYLKEGKIYGWYHTRFLLGLEDKLHPYCKSVDAAHWLERKEWWKKQLGLNYDTCDTNCHI
jgi:hypothetical protein